MPAHLPICNEVGGMGREGQRELFYSFWRKYVSLFALVAAIVSLLLAYDRKVPPGKIQKTPPQKIQIYDFDT